MKKLKTILLIALVIASSTTSLFATHWRVNNTPGSGAPFTTIQQAHDDAQVTAGDTLLLEPSGQHYGNLGWSKRLVIIGNGFLLSSNPETQANTASSIIHTLTFLSGATGSTLIGCQIPNGILIQGASNLFIMRNYLSHLNFAAGTYGSSIYILQNYCPGAISCSSSWNPAYYSEIFIENNVIGGISYSIGLVNCTNNVVLNLSNYCYNTTFRNNIITTISSDFSGIAGKGLSFYNNICAGTQVGTENGNQAGVDMNNVFVCYADCGNYSPDARYQLKPGSVAEGAGYGGVDCGMFDGNYPYILSGMPAIPAIYYLNTQSDGNSLDVSLKIKSHN